MPLSSILKWNRGIIVRTNCFEKGICVPRFNLKWMWEASRCVFLYIRRECQNDFNLEWNQQIFPSFLCPLPSTNAYTHEKMVPSLYAYTTLYIHVRVYKSFLLILLSPLHSRYNLFLCLVRWFFFTVSVCFPLSHSLTRLLASILYFFDYIRDQYRVT